MKKVKPIVPGQPYEKLQKLMEDYPFLGTILHYSMWNQDVNSPIQRPEMDVRFQVADTILMHTQAKNVEYDRRSYVIGPDEYRGTRRETFAAINENNEIMFSLDWMPGDYEKYAKDIFDWIDHKEVKYLIWCITNTWYWPASDVAEWEEDLVFDSTPRGRNVNVIVYKKPKDMEFDELVARAEKEKHKKENAYLYPPEEMPDLPGIEQALKEGCTVRSFSSGGGLRVIRVESPEEAIGIEIDELRGYGESPHVEEALVHASDDYLAGGRPYSEVYGDMYPHYLTGDTFSSSNIDYWIRKGSKFRCWQEDDQVVFQLSGLTQSETPQFIQDFVLKYLTSIRWRDKRGFYHKSEPCQLANDNIGVTTGIIDGPYETYVDVEVPEIIKKGLSFGRVRWMRDGVYYETDFNWMFDSGYLTSAIGFVRKNFKYSWKYFIGNELVTRIIYKEKKEPWMYRITKTGYGKNFWEAAMNAFDAPEVDQVKEDNKYDYFDLREEIKRLR